MRDEAPQGALGRSRARDVRSSGGREAGQPRLAAVGRREEPELARLERGVLVRAARLDAVLREARRALVPGARDPAVLLRLAAVAVVTRKHVVNGALDTSGARVRG